MQLGLEVCVFAVATVLIGKLGAVPLASHQIALNTATFTYMVPLGISSAAAVRVGQALGRNDAHGARRAGWTALALGSGFMTCTTIIFLVASRYIVRIYTPDPVVITVRERDFSLLRHSFNFSMACKQWRRARCAAPATRERR